MRPRPWPARAPVLDLRFVRAMAAVQEQGGFDRVLFAFHAESPDSLLVGQHVAAVTDRLGLMIAHRPGFTAPTLAGRQFATLDQVSGGPRRGAHHHRRERRRTGARRATI